MKVSYYLKPMNKFKVFKVIIWCCLVLSVLYGAGRLYYYVTAGFTVSNISSELPYDERFETKFLNKEAKNEIDLALSQNFHYLGKGCQSYVFLSDDGNYVIKFFKYQRFTPQSWLNLFSFIPYVNDYRLGKIEQKKKKLEDIFTSWKLAFDELQAETGLVFVHLNKTKELNKDVVLFDKMGIRHVLAIDNYEFLIQRRAFMLTDALSDEMQSGHIDHAKGLLDNLFTTLLSEYNRGLGDNDHALMQNTGVLNGMPIHIDVGQFVKNETFKETHVQAQEIFNKTYKFRIWLKKKYPELAVYLDEKLHTFIGPEINTLRPQLKNMACDEF